MKPILAPDRAALHCHGQLTQEGAWWCPLAGTRHCGRWRDCRPQPDILP